MNILRVFILGSWLLGSLFGTPVQPGQVDGPSLMPDAPRLVVFEGFLRPT